MDHLQFLGLLLFLQLASAADCPENEEYIGLGKCEGTCNNPDPECDWISTLFHLIPACRCRVDKGFVRNGKLSPLSPCIKVKDCPKKETPPPECPQNTVFRKCGSCEGTCYNPNPVCTSECRKPGCYCPADQGYVRSNVDGGCIPYWQCQTAPTKYPPVRPPTTQCGPNERWTECGGCDAYCEDSGKPCTERCQRKCECAKGHVRGWDNKCIPTHQCTAHPECARTSCPTGGKCVWYPQKCNWTPCPQVICQSPYVDPGAKPVVGNITKAKPL
ncbi:hypothetical protein QR680_016786 [Steinernema hermaphroditum]|uniref:TIL domain-containing protein n=1 Tax=Steinernema hermaphroditum TaxID=289476 RepID=A0AA39LMI0_9BILA|nr:hypothetical protein QR680_016786 [Steinernema hermaphroditum]